MDYKPEGMYPDNRITYEPEYHEGFCIKFIHEDEVRWLVDDGKSYVERFVRRALRTVKWGVLVRLAAPGSIDPSPWHYFTNRGDAYRWAIAERDRVNP